MSDALTDDRRAVARDAEPPRRGAIAPRDDARADLRRRLCRIFADTLGVPAVEPDADFFDLGGTSMLAISLLLAIETEIGRAFDIALIHEAPTVDALLARMELAERPARMPILLRDGSPSAPALFLFPGLGGTVFELQRLARQITKPIRIHGVPAIGLDGATPLERVEDMAQAFADLMEEVQPNGPYLLAGYSFGGLVAHEIARTLRARGREIAFLGLIDAYPDAGLSISAGAANVLRVVRSAPGARRAEIGRLVDLITFRLRIRLGLDPGLERVEGGDAAAAANPIPIELRRVRRASHAARQRYRLRASDCDAIFFRTTTRLPTFPADPRRIWRRYLRQLAVETVAGHHYSMVEDDSGHLAAALDRCLPCDCASPPWP